MGLAVVKDLRVARAPATTQDLEALETDVLAGFVLARAAARLSDDRNRRLVRQHRHIHLVGIDRAQPGQNNVQPTLLA